MDAKVNLPVTEKPKLSVRHLDFYYGGFHALKNITLDIPERRVTAFIGPAALRQVILSRPEAFVTTLTERILTYALGRGVEPTDMPVVRSIVKQSAPVNYRLSSIITGIVKSAPFQMRTKLEQGETVNQVAQTRVEQP